MISYRTCIITRKKYQKKELLKITKTKDGKWYFDKNQNIDGRSIYIAKDEENVIKFKKMRKRFKMEQMDFDTILVELGEIIEKKNL